MNHCIIGAADGGVGADGVLECLLGVLGIFPLKKTKTSVGTAIRAP